MLENTTRRLGIAAFAIGCLMMAQWSRAQIGGQDERLIFAPPSAASATEDNTRSPLMSALDLTGIGQALDKVGIKASAYAEGSYTYNVNNPPGSVNAGRSFDFESNAPRLNQTSITLERDVDNAAKQFDIGFYTQFLYGSDAGFLHSSGLFNYFPSPRDPINQPDLFQAYLTLAVPVGNGMRIAVGKFESFFGEESVEPTLNTFYSHTYMFNYGVPSTNTGVLAAYNINKNWTAAAGVSRGWMPDQTFNDNNSSPDVMGYIAYSLNEQTSFQFNAIGGPEQNHNDGNYRYLLEAMANCTPSKDGPWSFAAQADYGNERHANVISGQTEQWYGATVYATYTVNSYFAVSGRGEWFRDQGAARIGQSGSFYDATLGVSITPLPKDHYLNKFIIRPEVRYDYADHAYFNGLTRHDQTTLAVDAYLAM